MAGDNGLDGMMITDKVTVLMFYRLQNSSILGSSTEINGIYIYGENEEMKFDWCGGF